MCVKINDNKMDSELKLWVTWLICNLRPDDSKLPPVIFMCLVSFPFVLGQNWLILPQTWLLIRTRILYAEDRYSTSSAFCSEILPDIRKEISLSLYTGYIIK